MTYRLPDLWDHVAANDKTGRKVPSIFNSQVPRFSLDGEESPVKQAVKEHSLKSSVPSIETRPYTPFPQLLDEDFMIMMPPMPVPIPVTTLGGTSMSQSRVQSRAASPDQLGIGGGGSAGDENYLTKNIVTHPEIVVPWNPKGENDSLSLSNSHRSAVSGGQSLHSSHSAGKGPGFRFSKTGPAPTQWAIPACLPDVTYKRVSLGAGPGNAVILPVNPDKAEEELANLMSQLSLPSNHAKVSKSWAQTQFVAEHDPSLHLVGSPPRGKQKAAESRNSYSSRTIDTQRMGDSEPSERLSEEKEGLVRSSRLEGESLEGSNVSELAKNMIDDWKPPAIFSKKPHSPAKSQSSSSRNWSLPGDNTFDDSAISNGLVYGDVSRDMEILDFYNRSAAATRRASTANEAVRGRRAATPHSAKSTSRVPFYDRMQIKSNRKVRLLHFLPFVFVSKPGEFF